MEDRLLTTEEVLEYLHVNLRTVYRWVKAGQLPATRVGRQWRFRKSDLDAWLEGQRTPGGPRQPATAAGSRQPARPIARSEVRPEVRPGHRPWRILVVDEEDDSRELLKKSLGLADYEVDVVADGWAAFDALRREPYDLLVTGLRLPGLDGLSLVRETRRFLPGLPVVIVTAHSTEQDAVEALNLGVLGYVRKPLRVPRLLAMVARILGDDE
ncbi:MAG TPA: response regulator [Vicinamibacterales bacterium]|nr:response regulator [Vicinamibacterales bacterium]